MKTPSKLDQARAMREARYNPSPAVAALDDAKAITELPMETRARVSVALVKARARAVIGDTATDTVSWLAPEGECANCDKRRAALQATMRKRRAAKP